MSEYFEPGKSLAELHSLDEDDPWRQPDSETTLANQKRQKLEQQIFDKLEREGFFNKPAFVDPPDDEDPTIALDSSQTIFWRLTVHDERLIDIMEPSVEKLSISFKNTKDGCWMAFTSRRIATKVATSLEALGIRTYLSTCDSRGALIE